MTEKESHHLFRELHVASAEKKHNRSSTSQATPDIALSAYSATSHTIMQAIGKQTLKEISLKCVNGQLKDS